MIIVELKSNGQAIKMNQRMLHQANSLTPRIVTTLVNIEGIAQFEYDQNELHNNYNCDACDMAVYFIEDLQNLVTSFKKGNLLICII